MNPENLPPKVLGITRYGDARDKAFEPSEKTAPLERPKFWDKEPPKESLIQRLVNNLALRIVLAGTAIGGGYAAYEAVPGVHQAVDQEFLERVGLKAIVPPVFDNKAEATVLGRNNSFYITPEEYKEKGPPTVENRHVNIPFFIRFNDGKEHIIDVKAGTGGPGIWYISGDIKGGELLVPARENGEILGGGGTEGMPYLYKPGMSFSRFSSWRISLEDVKGGKIAFIVTTGALQTSKNLELRQDKIPKSFSGIGHIKGFAPIGTLLDDQPVFIAADITPPGGKYQAADTYISTTPTGQAYVLR